MRLLLLAVLFVAGCQCGSRVLVCYEITRVDLAPVAAGGNVVTYKRIAGPGPMTIEQTVRDAAIAAHPGRWKVGHRQWEWADRVRLEEAR